MNNKVSAKEEQALREIRNAFVHQGRIPSTRSLMKMLGYKSPRSSALLIKKLTKKGFLKRRNDGNLQFVRDLESDSIRANTVRIPLVGAASCGTPVFAEENIEAMIPVSTNLAKPPAKYFLLRTQGDSMNQKGINDGDVVLVRQQPKAEVGDRVVALIDDEATIKEFWPSENAIVLKPKSSNKRHKPIILTKDFQIQGVVVAVVPNL